MGVEVIGVGGEVNGHGDSFAAFRQANEMNAQALLNVAEGKHKNTPRPNFNPDHPDAQWPVMLYHPAQGEKVIGKSLNGMQGTERKNTEAENKQAVADLIKLGWRKEPYQKPQVALLDPASEKAALLKKNQELEGQIVAQNDVIGQMQTMLKTLISKVGLDDAKG